MPNPLVQQVGSKGVESPQFKKNKSPSPLTRKNDYIDIMQNHLKKNKKNIHEFRLIDTMNLLELHSYLVFAIRMKEIDVKNMNRKEALDAISKDVSAIDLFTYRPSKKRSQ